MTLAISLADFQASVSQVDSLIANSHQTDGNGNYLLPEIDRKQITVAAFLNMFIAWEAFLESSIAKLMSGQATISGTLPTKFVSPPSIEAAHKMIIGTNRYFDFANIDNVRKIIGMYFNNGYPFEPHLSGIHSDVTDLRTMRNASAHISTSTQASLEALSQRLLTTPQPGITLYNLLTAQMPGAITGRTVLAEFRDKLLAAAQLIAQG